MRESLKSMYADVVRVAVVMYQMNTTRQEGFVPVDQHVPVIPGAFPGECVTLTYSKAVKTKVRSVSVSVPAGNGTSMKVGPFPVPYGKTPEVPQAVMSLLENFERGGPERLRSRFRELVKELLRAGVGVGEIHDEVGLALAESVMNT